MQEMKGIFKTQVCYGLHIPSQDDRIIMENKFCYLKGLVDCSSGQIQDCNVKHVSRCPREEDTAKKESRQAFCFLKGLVDCAPCDVQDCNIKRVRRCPREN